MKLHDLLVISWFLANFQPPYIWFINLLYEVYFPIYNLNVNWKLSSKSLLVGIVILRGIWTGKTSNEFGNSIQIGHVQ